jgi:hypothetical protein
MAVAWRSWDDAARHVMTGETESAAPAAAIPTEGGDAASRLVRLERTLHWLLRLGVAGCFIGHGAYGFETKEAWVPYFGLVGIGRDTAYDLMPVVGTMDVSLGILTLLLPLRICFLHLTIWGIWTGMLRPLTGEPFFELVERGGNYGPPFAMLLLAGGSRTVAGWFRPVTARPLTELIRRRLDVTLRVTLFLLLFGHGWLAAIDHDVKQVWIHQHATVGLGDLRVLGLDSLQLSGWLEMAMGVLVLFWSPRSFLLAICAYKVATELLWPLDGHLWWEFLERAGDYFAPLALIALRSHEAWLASQGPPDRPGT